MSAKITPEESKRYNRQMILPSWGEEAQGVLKSSCVFIAGAGGLGSSTALYLAAAGVGILRICDSGSVELSNLNRQILHGDDRIGKDKVCSAERTLKGINPSTLIIPLAETIRTDNIASLVEDAGLIVDCLDNFESRYILNDYAVKTGIALVHAGVKGLCGQITFIHPPETPCLACLLPEGPPPEVIPILGATAGVIGCLEAMESLKYLTGRGELLKGRLLIFDGKAMQFQELRFDKNPACRVCSPANPAP